VECWSRTVHKQSEFQSNMDKTCNVRIARLWGEFVQPLLQWKCNKYYTLWVCVCSLGIQHAMQIRLIVICGLTRSEIFMHITSHTARLSKKRYWTQNVFLFALQILSETFLILRRTERNMIKISSCLHVKYPLFLSEFNKTLFNSIIFRTIRITFHGNQSSWSRVVPCGRTDMTELIVAFSQFWERA
jgi:hypothetical protein